MRNHPHQKPVKQSQPKSDHAAVAEDLDGEDEEGKAEANERFFESLDRVPSGVSINLDIPSSTSDSDCDDARFSFASALAPPQPSPLSDTDDDDPAFDYGIWMSETVSINERRRRLLQGFTSSNNIAAGAGAGNLKLSRSRLSLRTTPISRSSFSSHMRSRSDTDIVLHRSKELVTLRRASSAPPSLRGNQRRPGGGREAAAAAAAAAGGGGGGKSLPDETVCRIKNLDTGKEFVVNGALGRLNDPQTGKQMTLEEFERCLGYSPVVKEVMRRANLNAAGEKRVDASVKISAPGSSRRRKSGGWLKNFKSAASSMTGLISDKDRDGGLRRTSAAGGNEWMKVRQHGKSHKELTGLYMCQQIQAHQGAIWCIKFSLDSLYLASAGEDRTVHVWQVSESSALMRHDIRSSLPPLPPGNESPGQSTRMGIPRSKRTRKSKVSSASKRSSVPDYVVMPETVFSLSEKPVCSFHGHLDDVLDLSWSKSQYLLSSSMDKTVRLWDMESKACLKLFAHNDFVTCIQFNPVDDRYFISGSLDAKVRLWSIPDRQVVDWTDLHEMVTAVCYTPDGQGAWVGSHKGSCRFYNTSDCKLNQESQIDIWSKKKKSHAKKITGFQFVPGNPLEVMITSADSRVRVFYGVNMIHKFRGFRNTSSQISASFTVDGKYVMCPSEDSHVYLWKRNSCASGKSKGLITTRSHEHFYCKDVSVAIPWPNATTNSPPPPSPSGRYNQQGLDYPDSQDNFPSSRSDCPPLPKKSSPEHDVSPSSQEALRYPFRSGSAIGSSNGSLSSSLRSDATISSYSVSASSSSSNSSRGWYRGGSSSSNNNSTLEVTNAWGLVVVTAGLGGDIKIYQNFGLPLRLSRQTTLLF